MPDLFVYLTMMGWIQPFLLGHLRLGFLGSLSSGYGTGLFGIGLQSGRVIGIAGRLGAFSAILLLLHIAWMIRKCPMLPVLPPPTETLIRFSR